MSAEADMELARAGLQAWNEDDWENMEANMAPDVVMTAPEAWPESGTFRGWPAIRRQYERLKEGLRDERAELLVIEAQGDGTVLVQFRWLGTWESGLDLDMDMWAVYVFEDGRFAEIHFHMDEASARKQLGD